ncbi:hypothetical protein PPACK8108_LOCUS16287 [Phakopsora pachyrhizi]|uniref:Uncharacterized protein n=1 Tax=Phakopsora pachyrhizi TaxID=170000 RepID=A0AAV0B9W4_PHAPC|nr:hypothetical protein PPACK8108_LOCUS16287 [Phakopsora pachyrhizi]
MGRSILIEELGTNFRVHPGTNINSLNSIPPTIRPGPNSGQNSSNGGTNDAATLLENPQAKLKSNIIDQAGFAGLGRREDWLQRKKGQAGLRGMLVQAGLGRVSQQDRDSWAGAKERAGRAEGDAGAGRAWSKAGQGHMEGWGLAWLLSGFERQARRQIDCNLPWCCKGGRKAGFAGLGQKEGLRLRVGWLGFNQELNGRHGGKSIAICFGAAKEAGRQGLLS